MTRSLTLKRAVTVLALTATWCGLWRDVSLGNLVVGALLAGGVTGLGVATPDRGGVRTAPLARFGLLVANDLVKSTASVAHEILTPTDHTEEAIVAVRLPPESSDHLLLLVVAITLTPGTAVVDADSQTSTLYLHLLHHERREATVAHVRELARLACLGLPRRTGVTS